MLRDLNGAATRTVAAPAADCFSLVAAVDTYPDWYPEVVREVVVLEREPDGRARRARTKLHLAWGPVVKDFDLVMAVTSEPQATVKLARVSDRPSQSRFDVTWRLRDEGSTLLRLELAAALDVPRFLPLAGIGDAVARGFVDAAARRLGVEAG